MCLGIPMRVESVEGPFAWCEGHGRRERLNTLWLEDVQPGDWVYAVLGQAREKLTPARAAEIDRALAGVAAALADETQLDAYFPDLTEHKP